MASVDSLLENGVTSTTDPARIFPTSPPDLKKAGVVAPTLSYGIGGAVRARPATSTRPAVMRHRGAADRARAMAYATTLPIPRNPIVIRRAGSALAIRGRAPTIVHGSAIGVTTPSTCRWGPSESIATTPV